MTLSNETAVHAENELAVGVRVECLFDVLGEDGAIKEVWYSGTVINVVKEDEPDKRSFVDVWFDEDDDVQCQIHFHGQIPYPANRANRKATYKSIRQRMLPKE